MKFDEQFPSLKGHYAVPEQVLDDVRINCLDKKKVREIILGSVTNSVTGKLVWAKQENTGDRIARLLEELK